MGLISLLTICVVLVILLAAAALGGFYAVIRHPPVIKVEIVPPDQTAQVASRQAAALIVDEPIPQDVLDYIDQESEDHARNGRRQRARHLRAETGSWDSAFRMLQREDSLE